MQDMMAIENDSNHVSGVMAEALSHLNRVVEHVCRVSHVYTTCWG